MQCVFPATRTELAELETIRIVPPILLGGVITFLAVATLKGDDRSNILLLGSHATLPAFF